MKSTTFPLLAVLALAACTVQKEESAPAGDSSLGRSTSMQDASKPMDPVTKPAPDPSRQKLNRAVTCREGDAERTLWVSDDLVVELEPSAAGRDELLRSDPAAQEVAQKQSGVRVWRVAAAQDIDVFSRGLNASVRRFSPVLHETDSPGSPMRALPGGVLATFKPSWDRAQIDRWLAARGLAVDKEVGSGMHMYLIATEPGLIALETSNQLSETGELAACEPNWWRQASTR